MNTQTVRGKKLDDARRRQVRQRQLARRRKKKIRRLAFRSIFTAAVICLALFALLFLTPLFNVKNVTVTGNKRITDANINELIPSLKGENLFKISRSSVKQRLSDVAYVKEVDIEKKYFPASVVINLTEYTPYAYFQNGEEYSVINEKCEVLELTSEQPDDLPLLLTYTENASEVFSDEEALKSLTEFFAIEGRVGINNEVTEIELTEDKEILFTYDDRLDVICGSNYDMEQKLRLFKVTVNNPDLLSNAHGTMDLSVVGKASYLP